VLRDSLVFGCWNKNADESSIGGDQSKIWNMERLIVDPFWTAFREGRTIKMRGTVAYSKVNSNETYLCLESHVAAM
jgi:hypothetical protein